MSLAYYARNVASGERSRRRMMRAGVTMKGQKLWDDTERQVLMDCRGDYVAMRKRLRHRTKHAIFGECAKLGIRKSIHVWSAAEVSKLRKMYPKASIEEISSAFPHSAWVNIRQVARYHGFRRASTLSYKLTGIPALDDVRRRCREIGWSMADLDKAARTGRYFRRAGWIGKRINHRALGRAIEALDGVIQAQWNEE
ncbi:hypothetical protein [Rhizobium sp. CF080]|uniref:hypothetical protein n=1 Tax=Rhizobium sp. (strain CF080) TaxID=1144310 RepID=UPI00055FAFBB|nr:hypothetical protein [Rhizobium sp. CF080]